MKNRERDVQKHARSALNSGERKVVVFRSRVSAWPDFDSIVLYTHRDMYILAEHCPICGEVPLYRGHRCWDTGLEISCPACGKLIYVSWSGEEPQVGEHCNCSEVFCPFCSDCSKQLDLDLAEPIGIPQ